MSINDAVELANNIIKNIKTGNNIGEEISLEEYDKESRKRYFFN